VTKLLTTAAVVKLRAGRDRIEVKDGGTPSLYLVIYPTGQKSFSMKFRRPSGKLARLTLGYFSVEATGDPVVGGPLSLPMARRLAAEVNHQRAVGIDVIGARHRSKLESQARGAATFCQAAIDFVNQHARRQNKGWRSSIRVLGIRVNDDDELEMIPKGLADRWRDRPISEIDSDDIHLIIDEAREKGVPGLERRADGPPESMARALHAEMSKMFSWLVEKRRVKVSPVVGVAKPKVSNKRDRVLSDDEMKKFWLACEKISEPARQCLRILLLTGNRLDEVREMRGGELSADGKTWTIPGARTKNKLTHVVPLSPLVRSLIESVETTGQFVFTINGKTPVAMGSELKSTLDASMKIPPWQFRDLRRTAATGMADIGIAPHIVEAALNHISGSKAGVAGTYNRALYKEEKAAALERWAAHIEGLVSGRAARVLPLKFNKKA
jgi:integrase